jgi:hypothetical protein
MERGELTEVRRVFFRALLRGLRILWPVLSGLLGMIAGLGAIVGLMEGWGIAQGMYFSFVTGLTIGYGDLAPSRALTRILAVAIGLLGIVATGLIAALAVTAFQATPARGRRPAVGRDTPALLSRDRTEAPSQPLRAAPAREERP